MTTTILSAGEEYEMRVIAENEAGLSQPSDGSGRFKAKDPFSPPDRPDAPDVTAINRDTASLAWQPPAHDGGAPVTHYTVEMRRVGDVKWRVVTQDARDLAYDVTGLTEGDQYEFRIYAVNKAGPSDPSPPSKPAKYSKLYL